MDDSNQSKQPKAQGQNIQIKMANLSNVTHKTNKCPYHIRTMHVLNVILKRIKTSFREVIMEKTHVKEKYETKNKGLVFKA